MCVCMYVLVTFMISDMLPADNGVMSFKFCYRNFFRCQATWILVQEVYTPCSQMKNGTNNFKIIIFIGFLNRLVYKTLTLAGNKYFNRSVLLQADWMVCDNEICTRQQISFQNTGCPKSNITSDLALVFLYLLFSEFLLT